MIPPVCSCLRENSWSVSNSASIMARSNGCVRAANRDSSHGAKPPGASQKNAAKAPATSAAALPQSITTFSEILPRAHPAGSSTIARAGFTASHNRRASVRCRWFAPPPIGPCRCQPVSGTSITASSNLSPACRQTKNLVFPGQTPARLNRGFNERSSLDSRLRAADSLGQN